MAPLKYEDEFREKLEQRAISPSNDSWSRLSSQLDTYAVSRKRKTKNYRLWIGGIAASIIGILLALPFLLDSTNDSPITKEQYVVIDSLESGDTPSKETTPSLEKQKEQIVATNLIQQEEKTTSLSGVTQITNTKASADNSSSKISKLNAKNSQKNYSVNKIVQNETLAQNNGNSDILNDELQIEISHKIKEVASIVSSLQNQNQAVTDDEIEQLLRKAQLEITTERILTSNTIDASALLLDVESELDDTFKERVFEALKTGFKKLKTSVAEVDH